MFPHSLRRPTRLSSRGSSLGPGLSLVGLVVFPFLAAAILAPGAWHLFHGVLHYPFHRYVDRCLMLSALLGLWLFWKGLGLRSGREIGWIAPKRFALPTAFLLGLVSATVALSLAVAFHGRDFAGAIHCGTALGILAGAVALGIAEEVLFRGVVQRVLEKRFGIGTAIVAGSLLFALLHYLKVPSAFEPNPPGMLDGFHAVGLAFTPLAGLGWLQPRFGLLVGVGLVLAVLRHRSGSLWPGIALHAGWVVAARIGNHLTLGYPSHWAGGDFSTNPLSFLCLALALLCVWKSPVFSKSGSK